MINKDDPAVVAGPLFTGVDLGTADMVVMALDQRGVPVACFLEWAEVVRDGVVVDFIGAADIVRKLVDRAQERLGREITSASTSFPPGTDQRLSTNILERASLEVTAVQDEPSCVAQLLELDKAAVVPQDRVVFSGDEPTGGRHITLSIAGHFGIDFAQAEKYNILNLALPTLQRITDIVGYHIKGRQVERIILSGGTFLLPGADQVFVQELVLPVELPCQSLLLTPLAITSLSRNTEQ